MAVPFTRPRETGGREGMGTLLIACGGSDCGIAGGNDGANEGGMTGGMDAGTGGGNVAGREGGRDGGREGGREGGCEPRRAVIGTTRGAEGMRGGDEALATVATVAAVAIGVGGALGRTLGRTEALRDEDCARSAALPSCIPSPRSRSRPSSSRADPMRANELFLRHAEMTWTTGPATRSVHWGSSRRMASVVSRPPRPKGGSPAHSS